MILFSGVGFHDPTIFQLRIQGSRSALAFPEKAFKGDFRKGLSHTRFFPVFIVFTEQFRISVPSNGNGCHYRKTVLRYFQDLVRTVPVKSCHPVGKETQPACLQCKRHPSSSAIEKSVKIFPVFVIEMFFCENENKKGCPGSPFLISGGQKGSEPFFVRLLLRIEKKPWLFIRA